MIRGEVHEDIGVARADRRRCRIGQVDAAVGDADVVDDGRDLASGNQLPDRLLDSIAQGRGLIDADAGGTPQVELDLAGVDAREEILSEAGHVATERESEEGGGGHRGEERHGEARSGRHGPLEQLVVVLAHLAEPLLEAPLQELQAAEGAARARLTVRIVAL